MLTFLGTNYHGIKTGNVGYILGFLIAYFFSINSDKSNSKLSSIIMGFLLMIKPFYLFWFGILYISTKLLKINIKIFYNLNYTLSSIFTFILLNVVFYKTEFVYFIENLLQINTSINKPLNDKAGFLNLNFQDYIYRIFERYFGIEINKIIIIFITLVILYYFRNFFGTKNNMTLLPVFITPRFKSYDLTFLIVLFKKKKCEY